MLCRVQKAFVCGLDVVKQTQADHITFRIGPHTVILPVIPTRLTFLEVENCYIVQQDGIPLIFIQNKTIVFFFARRSNHPPYPWSRPDPLGGDEKRKDNHCRFTETKHYYVELNRKSTTAISYHRVSGYFFSLSN